MYSRSLSDKLKERDRRVLDLTQPIVGEEWSEPTEPVASSIVAPRVIGYTRKVLWGLLALSVVFFIGAASFFAYYFTLGGGSGGASPNNIDISISGPPQISGGEPTKLQVVVTNRNKVSLDLAELVITYPDGTRSPTDYKTDFPNQRIPLGNIEPGGQRQGTVTAVFTGGSGEHKAVKVEVEYHVQGSNAIFVAPQNYDIILNSAPISIAVDGNTQTISGQPIQLTIDVSSNTSAPIRDVLVHVDYPFGFKFSSASPAASGDNLWAIGDLSAGEKKTIVLSGSLSGESGDSRVFRIQAGTRSTPTAQAISTQITENAFAMQISQSFLGLSVSANKQTGSTVIAAPGENVIVNVAYQNNLSTVITDAVVVARLSGIEIDGTTVHTNDGFYRSSDSTVLWDKTTTNGALSTLPPGGKGTLQFSFQMPTPDQLKGIVNPKLSISINAAGKRVSETGVPQNLQAAARQDVKLTSDLQINSQALYYANPFGSSGPMPPKANVEDDLRAHLHGDQHHQRAPWREADRDAAAVCAMDRHIRPIDRGSQVQPDRRHLHLESWRHRRECRHRRQPAAPDSHFDRAHAVDEPDRAAAGPRAGRDAHGDRRGDRKGRHEEGGAGRDDQPRTGRQVVDG